MSANGNPWRRFLATLALATLAPMLVVFLFVSLIDPWGMLPVHLPLARAPISTNARFSFPALAISKRYDAAVFGTSTSRLLRPAVLDRLLDARFANLSMNAATAWEQSRLFVLFARNHRDARAVVLGLDQSWCLADAEAPKLTGRAFPAWMYGGTRWRGYSRMFDLYAVQEAWNQLMTVLGLKRRVYGLDGYTDFLPPDAEYDAGRVARKFRSWGPIPASPAGPEDPHLPYVEDLASLLGRVRPDAAKILFIPPLALEWMGPDGSQYRRDWDVCKREAAAQVRRIPNAVLLDFAIPDRITLEHANFWDPLHYRVAIADLIMADLAAAAAGHAPGPEARLLARGPASR